MAVGEAESDGDHDQDVAAIVSATMVWANSAKKLRIAADADPTSDSTRRWNECVTAAEQAQECLCKALVPGRPELGEILRFSGSDGDPTNVAKIAADALRGPDADQ